MTVTNIFMRELIYLVATPTCLSNLFVSRESFSFDIRASDCIDCFDLPFSSLFSVVIDSSG